MKIASWNVNSLRSRADLVERFMTEVSPDVLVLQETKCNDANFPWMLFAGTGYEVAHLGDGSRSGVALACSHGLHRVQYGFGGEHGPPFDEPRLIAADIADIRIVNVYAPNGGTIRSAHWHYKLAWFELLRVEIELAITEATELLVIGDFNVCPTAADLYKPSKRHRNLVSDEERVAMARIVDLGLIDLARQHHPDDAGYTWFSHRPGQFESGKGYRLDLALASNTVAERSTDCAPAFEWRSPEIGPSDHAPLIVDIGEREPVRGPGEGHAPARGG